MAAAIDTSPRGLNMATVSWTYHLVDQLAGKSGALRSPQGRTPSCRPASAGQPCTSRAVSFSSDRSTRTRSSFGSLCGSRGSLSSSPALPAKRPIRHADRFARLAPAATGRPSAARAEHELLSPRSSEVAASVDEALSALTITNNRQRHELDLALSEMRRAKEESMNAQNEAEATLQCTAWPNHSAGLAARAIAVRLTGAAGACAGLSLNVPNSQARITPPYSAP